MRVCVVGSVNNDLTFVVDRLPQPGATVLASSLVYAPGGKGANQAIAQHLGGKSLRLHRGRAEILKVSLNRRQKFRIDTGKLLQITPSATIEA